MWRAATAVAERHRGGAIHRDPITDAGFPRPLKPAPPLPVAGASPPYPRRGALIPSFATETKPIKFRAVLCTCK
jgi:hypothetical protein